LDGNALFLSVCSSVVSFAFFAKQTLDQQRKAVSNCLSAQELQITRR
jgi:hypothetical protein